MSFTLGQYSSRGPAVSVRVRTFTGQRSCGLGSAPATASLTANKRPSPKKRAEPAAYSIRRSPASIDGTRGNIETSPYLRSQPLRRRAQSPSSNGLSPVPLTFSQ